MKINEFINSVYQTKHHSFLTQTVSGTQPSRGAEEASAAPQPSGQQRAALSSSCETLC